MANENPLKSFAGLVKIPGDFLNKLQLRALAIPANLASLDPDPHTTAEPAEVSGGTPLVTTITNGPGGVNRYGITAEIQAGKVLALDDSEDMRDRFLEMSFNVFDDVDYLPGGATAHSFRTGALVPAPTVHGRLLQTLKGSQNAAAAANPGVGDPPVFGGTGDDFIVPLIDSSSDLLLYVERYSPYRLCVYNAGAGSYWLTAWWRTTSKLGKY